MMDAQTAIMPLIPRRVKVGKRCLIYCGDDRCDCDAGPLGRYERERALPKSIPGVITADGLPPYPPASLTDPGCTMSMTPEQARYNHHRGDDYLGDVARLGFVRFDVLGPRSSLDPAHERFLRLRIDVPRGPTRRILYRLSVRNRWALIENLDVRSGEILLVWAEGRDPQEAYAFRVRQEDGPEGYVLGRNGPGSLYPMELDFAPTHWRLDYVRGSPASYAVPPGWYRVDSALRPPPRDGDHIEVGVAERDEFVYKEVFRGCGLKRPAAWLEVDGQAELLWEPTHWRYPPSRYKEQHAEHP